MAHRVGLAGLLFLVGWLHSEIAAGQASPPPWDGGERIFLPFYELHELVLRGITKTPKGSIAAFEVAVPEGPDRPLPPPRPRTFFAKVGDRFYDARIVEIGESTVTVEKCAAVVPCGEAAKKSRKSVRTVLKVGKRESP